MFLYLVQHAEAKSREEDPSRSLSGKGIQDITKTAGYASGLGLPPFLIFHSGKKRAMQTARVLDDYLNTEKGLSGTDGLLPMDDPQVWFERLSQMEEDIMLVGHLPHLASFSALILCGDKDKNLIDFKMGCIVCLRRFSASADSPVAEKDGNWSVEWMITPEVIK